MDTDEYKQDEVTEAVTPDTASDWEKRMDLDETEADAKASLGSSQFELPGFTIVDNTRGNSETSEPADEPKL